MITLILSLLIGIGLGILAGLTPGLHINILSVVLLTYSSFFGFLGVEGLMVAIVSMAIVANYFEFIKALLFGIPDEGNVLSVYPTQRLLMDGRGLEAIKLCGFGCLCIMLLAIALFPIMSPVIGFVHSYMRRYTGVLLLAISLHLMIRDKKKEAFVVFALSGVLGLFALNMAMKEPLLPLLTGMFGLSMLLTSGNRVPKQMASVVVEVEKRSSILGIVVGFLGVSVLSVIPAIGPTQASLLASELRDKRNYKEFLISIGGINTADIIFSILALWTIGKPRSGAIAAVNELAGTLSSNQLYMLLVACLVSGIVGYFLMMAFGSFVCKRVHKLDYGKIKYGVAAFVSFLTFTLDPILGLVVLALSTAIGWYAERYDVNKSHCMGCLIIPTILYYMR